MNNKRYLNEMGGGRVSGPAHGGQRNRGCCDLLRVINRALQSALVYLSPSTPSQCLLFHDQSARHRTCPPGRGRTKHEVRTTEFPPKLRLEQRQMFIYFPHGKYKYKIIIKKELIKCSNLSDYLEIYHIVKCWVLNHV